MRFSIANMDCGGCVRGVTKAVQGVDAAATVTADVERRTVDIRSTRPASLFVPALAAAGFPALPLQAET